MVAVRGVALLSRLGAVKLWHWRERQSIIVSLPWWKPESGQTSTEYALLLGVGGVLVLGLWFMSGLTPTDVLRLVAHLVFSGWADTWFS